MKIKNQSGTTLIEVVMAIGLVAMLFGGLYLFYESVLDVVQNFGFRVEATTILNREAEIVRNLPYGSVGTLGGFPSGVLLQTKTVTSTNGKIFTVRTTVRNIDDPFDGTLGGSPNDTAPADYKLVEIQVENAAESAAIPLVLSLRVAPKNLESATTDGSLFINVFDSNGKGISGAQVRVVLAPTYDLTDTTNQNGILQLVGIPTSTQGYQITVTKDGYSTDKTYAIGDPTNPNPIKVHATVVAQTLTQTSFQIDKFSSLDVYTSSPTCTAIGNQSYTWEGARLIGTSPDVIKFSTSSKTNGDGVNTFPNVEWDSYAFSYGDALDLLGTIPLSTYSIPASSTVSFRFVLLPSAPNSLLVTVKDVAGGGAISDATVALTKTGFSNTQITGQYLLTNTDWSGGNYFSESETYTETSGEIRMKDIEDVYSTTTISWLISKTIDLGSSSSSAKRFLWLPLSQDPSTGNESVQFQLAANNDNITWNFVGPGGDPNLFFTSANTLLDSSFSEKRYIRYKVFLKTQNSTVSPRITDVSIGFSGPCVPLGQVLFSDLSLGTYSLTATASGYSLTTSTVSINGAWNQTTILLNTP